MNVHELASKYEDYLISTRRYLHMHPELSLQEENTSKLIQKELGDMGIPFEVVGHRNVVGVIDTGKPGKRLAIRADIDALPIQEEIDSEFKSVVPNVMHACGHDCHTATLLAAAKCLMEIKDQLKGGKIYLCFQVAEEISGPGPEEIIAYLKKQGGVDEVIGNHMTPALPANNAAMKAGPSNAGNCQWRITVHGRGGHGSRPDLAIDPLRPAALILNAVAAIPSNRHAAFNPLVVNPCMIHGGTAYNIVPDEAYIEGNIRYFHAEELEEVLKLMDETAKGIASAFGATAECVKIAGCPPVENNADVAARVKKVMEAQGVKVFVSPMPSMGSDDFGTYTQAFPACYFGFGASSDRPDASHNLHNSKLFYDEKGLLPITEFFVNYALDLLNE